ncbi:rRNA maturation RNase YbeY [Maribacter halichondriae]|uniref:rRNA maturation RNase YbeY n=1 Tax=Maribacter halichondriae TaxID=2980554 RepID=UPI0023597BB5|nr:rRNA maturation RNase YbeY [Maribacter sp. Hal144]
MIDFNYETDFSISSETHYADWIGRVVASEESIVGRLEYIFCDDDYLLKINQKYLNHDAYTDIISFDYSTVQEISGDIFISVDRLKDNARKYRTNFDEELLRVMAHGVLHFLGYKDKSHKEKAIMRSKEEEKIKMFHVEQ